VCVCVCVCMYVCMHACMCELVHVWPAPHAHARTTQTSEAMGRTFDDRGLEEGLARADESERSRNSHGHATGRHRSTAAGAPRVSCRTARKDLSAAGAGGRARARARPPRAVPPPAALHPHRMRGAACGHVGPRRGRGRGRRPPAPPPERHRDCFACLWLVFHTVRRPGGTRGARRSASARAATAQPTASRAHRAPPPAHRALLRPRALAPHTAMPHLKHRGRSFFLTRFLGHEHEGP